jgi:hypothetical protein
VYKSEHYKLSHSVKSEISFPCISLHVNYLPWDLCIKLDMIAYFCTVDIYSKNKINAVKYEIYANNIQKFRSYLPLRSPDLHYKGNCLIAIFEIITL